MRSGMRRKATKILIFIPLLIAPFFQVFSQERTLISPYFQLQFIRDNEDQKVLRTTLTYSKNRMELPLEGMKISFFSGPAHETLIAEVLTDNHGVATVALNNKKNLVPEKNGSWSFYSEFGGNDTIEAGNSEIWVTDVTMKMDLTVVDSVRYVKISLSKSENGNEVPVKDEIIAVYVPRMFSLLPVGEITLDENGTGSLEFPSGLPGDKDGNITLIVRIEEHPDFGSVEKLSSINWGVVPDYTMPSGHRALWTKTAPRWMIYTLTILLTGVWAHYLYTVICLIRIKKDAKKQILEETESL